MGFERLRHKSRRRALNLGFGLEELYKLSRLSGRNMIIKYLDSQGNAQYKKLRLF